MEYLRRMYFFIAIFAVIVFSLVFIFQKLEKNNQTHQKVLYVLSYSNFIKDWGPGPEIAKKFMEEHNVRIRWVEVTNAGMIIEYLANNNNYPIDLVIGLDVLSLRHAEQVLQWQSIPMDHLSFVPELNVHKSSTTFVPLDWAPMTFIYKRKAELPPQKLVDLKNEKFINALGLQDPNSSSTGMYFLIWVLSVMGEEKGFEYLYQLKSSVRLISPSWSAGYSLFQNDQIPYIFSYFTSPLYHHLIEKNFNYQPVFFDEPHIYSVEYGAVPVTCSNCDLARTFLLFLLEPENQKMIMYKNFMLPAIRGIKDKTEFDFPKSIKLISPDKIEYLLNKKQELLEKWNALGL